jgi:Uma2 family endonuclease
MQHTIVDEITLREDKPAWEWINDRPVQKMSPRRPHARLQAAFATALETWSAGRGEANTEWGFRVTPPGERTRPLVPDVAYMSYERLRSLEPEDRDIPPIPPEIVVEIISPGDLRRDMEEKIRVYLAFGVGLVLHVDPRKRTIDAHEAHGTHVSGSLEAYTPGAFPDLTFNLAAIFATIDIPPA